MVELIVPVPPGARLLEVSHVAHRLGASQDFVRRLIREGRLPAVRLSPRFLRVDARDLETYIEACRTAHTRPDDDRKEPRRVERSA
jgi:excisionase family DNA binding protein